MSALTIAAVVAEVESVLDVHVVEVGYRRRRQKWATKWGVGTSLMIRIEPEAEASTWAQYKHLYGHLYGPVSRRTGETVADVHLRMKLQFMPDDGRSSLTQLDRVELAHFTEAVEQDIRDNDPDSWDDCVAAMALYDRG